MITSIIIAKVFIMDANEKLPSSTRAVKNRAQR
jgi:uncharacterized membrane protein (DUF485 family)